MDTIIFITSLSLLIAPITIFRNVVNKTFWFIFLILSPAPTIAILIKTKTLLEIWLILQIYSTFILLNIDNILSYIIVVESLGANLYEKNRALNFAIISSIIFRGSLIFIGTTLPKIPKTIFNIITIVVLATISKYIYMRREKHDSQQKKSLIFHSPYIKLSGILIVTTIAECIFSIDSIQVAISQTSSRYVSQITNISAMLMIKPLTMLINISNQSKLKLEDKIIIPIILLLTKTVFLGIF